MLQILYQRLTWSKACPSCSSRASFCSDKTWFRFKRACPIRAASSRSRSLCKSNKYTFSLNTNKIKRSFRNSSVNFAKHNSSVLERIKIHFNAQTRKWAQVLAHKWYLIYVGQMDDHSCQHKRAFLFLISSEIYWSITLLIRIQQFNF